MGPKEPRLAELITSQMALLRLTYHQVEERSRAAGFPVASSTVHALATRKLRRSPSLEVLQGLAAGLELDLVELQRATLLGLGWDLTKVIKGDDELLFVHRTVDSMVQQLREHRRGRERDSA